MSSLQMLLKRISEGDAAAEEEFVREYQPHVRRHVRTRLRLRRIRRISDTSDICQVVLASVMVRCALGQYDIDDSGAMRRLLIRIADHKVIDLARKPEFRFPHLSISRMDEDGIEPADSKSSPTSELVLDELIAKGGQLLTDTERAIVELRRKGMSWDEVGEELAMKGDACRKRHGRAVERIVRELGLEGPRDD